MNQHVCPRHNGTYLLDTERFLPQEAIANACVSSLHFKKKIDDGLF